MMARHSARRPGAARPRRLAALAALFAAAAPLPAPAAGNPAPAAPAADTAAAVAAAREALAAAIRDSGRDSQPAADARRTLALALAKDGQVQATVDEFAARLAIVEKLNGADAVPTIKAAAEYTGALQGQAEYLDDLGDYAAAEPVLQKIISYYTRFRGEDDAGTLRFMRKLAINLKSQGRPAEAEPLMRRTVELMEKTLGPTAPDTLSGYNDLGRILESQFRHPEAEKLYRKAYEAGVAGLGRDTPRVLVFAQNLGASLMYQQRFAEAEPIVRDTLDRRTRVLGKEHPERLYSLSDLATVLTFTGDTAGAGKAYDELLPLADTVFGPKHPHTAQIRNSYAVYLDRAGGRQDAALAEARKAADTLRQRRQAIGLDARGQRSLASFTETDAFYFETLLNALRKAGDAPDANHPLLLAEAVQVIQEAMESPANTAVIQQAAQRAAGAQGPDMARLAARRQALSDQWATLAKERNALLADKAMPAARRQEATAALDTRQRAIDAAIAEIDGELRTRFPGFFDMIRPRPLDYAAAGALLADGTEAALLIQPTPFGTHVIALGGGKLDWAVSRYPQATMDKVVRRLLWDVGAPVDVSVAEDAEWSGEGKDQGPYPYDRRLAWFLYRELIEPVEWLLKGKRHVYIVAGGSFSSLPFGMLVAGEPQGKDGDPQALRQTPWLSDKYALVQLPSLQSLQFLREYGRHDAAMAKGFLGFGDPVLDGTAAVRGGGRGLRGSKAAVRSGAVAGAWRDSGADSGEAMVDVEALRHLARLPGTAKELEQMRAVLAAPMTSVMTGPAATETAVKSARLADASILAFATHGLLAGEVNGNAEPGLVFTPPARPSPEDDGLLSMSEIASLKLNADWVILSACNTAAGDGSSGAPGLSGLAKAFFLAGTSSLLASHWPVRDDVAAKLTVRAIAIARDNPKLSKAEALQQAMREIRNDASADSDSDTWAHPNAWAPFTLIGDGRR